MKSRLDANEWQAKYQQNPFIREGILFQKMDFGTTMEYFRKVTAVLLLPVMLHGAVEIVFQCLLGENTKMEMSIFLTGYLTKERKKLPFRSLLENHRK